MRMSPRRRPGSTRKQECRAEADAPAVRTSLGPFGPVADAGHRVLVEQVEHAVECGLDELVARDLLTVEVFAVDEAGTEKLCALAQGTIAVLPEKS